MHCEYIHLKLIFILTFYLLDKAFKQSHIHSPPLQQQDGPAAVSEPLMVL